jgi:ketosteroid isomerase-like protein
VSEANVQTVNEIMDAWRAGDVDRMAKCLADDAEFRPIRAELENRTYIGVGGLREVMADFERDWEELHVVAEEVIGRGDVVVTLGRLRARGRASGIELDLPLALLFHLREGKIVRIESFREPQDGLRAAGIEAGGADPD